MSGLLINYLGQGIEADRDPAGPDIHPAAIGFWYSTDTEQLWFWGNGAWTESTLGALPTSITDLLAVDGTNGQIIRRVGGVWVADNESIAEAAIDGNKYGRKNGAWAIINEGIADAPSDGVRYVRKDNAWVSLAAYLATLGYIGDAPVDGTQYVRKDGGWVTNTAGGLADAPADGVRYVRKDNAWVSLLSYLTSAGYLTDAPNDGTEYVRKSGAWAHPASTGALVRIDRQALVANAATIHFAAIPGTYEDLILVVMGQLTGNADFVYASLNTDVAANYHLGRGFFQTSGIGFSSGVANGLDVGLIDGISTSGASYAGLLECTIYSYARTTFRKRAMARSTLRTGTTSSTINTEIQTSEWSGTAAVNDIVLTPGSGSFVTGTVATLYGRS